MATDAHIEGQLPEPSSMEYDGITHNYYRLGSGAPIVLMHELPGMTAQFIKLALRISECFTVYVPHFFGPLGKHDSLAGFRFCLRGELQCFARNRPSPLADWLRALCRRAHEEGNGFGVGVIGLCLTGNIVISLMVEPVVRVPVMCEPAMPFLHKNSLGVPDEDLRAAAGRREVFPLLAYRFDTDKICPVEKFHALHNAFGENVRLTTIATGERPYFIPNGSHPVLTGGYKGEEDPNHPVQHVIDEILLQMRRRLRPI